jgi:hypothetical protein
VCYVLDNPGLMTLLSRQALEIFTSPHRIWASSRGSGVSFCGTKAAGKVYHVSPYIAKVKNEFRCTSTAPCVFMTRTAITLNYQLVFKRRFLLVFYFKIFSIFLEKISFLFETQLFTKENKIFRDTDIRI